MNLRWATWNVWALGPAWVDRLDAACEVLRHHELDLICLQEVRRDDDVDGALRLASDLGLHLARAESVGSAWWTRRIGSPSHVDKVVLSRWPVADLALQRLPATAGAGHSAGEVRTALHVTIDAPVPLRVVSTQLTSSPMQSAGRVAQVQALVAELVRRQQVDEVVLVAGDMNAEPDSDEMRLLGGHKTAPPVEGHVLMDLWRFADPSDDSSTWDRANPHVAATGEPSCRIDYLFSAPLPSGRLPLLRSIRRFGDTPVGLLWPSDHAGVTATLDLR